MISLTIPGKPVPWARARGHKGRYYNPQPQREHRDMVALLLREAAMEQGMKGILTGPLDVSAVFDYGEEETRMTVDQILEGADGVPRTPFSSDGFFYRIARPDLDNLVKQIMEALEDSRLVGDDAQVAMLHAEKWK